MVNQGGEIEARGQKEGVCGAGVADTGGRRGEAINAMLNAARARVGVCAEVAAHLPPASPSYASLYARREPPSQPSAFRPGFWLPTRKGCGHSCDHSLLFRSLPSFTTLLLHALEYPSDIIRGAVSSTFNVIACVKAPAGLRTVTGVARRCYCLAFSQCFNQKQLTQTQTPS